MAERTGRKGTAMVQWNYRSERNEVLAKQVIAGCESRNMEAWYAKTREEALEKALSLIPEGASCGAGGCYSAAQIGLLDALQNGNYNWVGREARDADFFIASANGMTADGVIVNIDGMSNRVACIAHGPKNVLFIVGMNKITADVDSAMKRARNEAAPINTQRIGCNTPCTKTGTCMNCKSPDTICCNILITRFSRIKGRIKVILVDEELGF